jgi:NitT/TauT family transport system substrate-binding protein
VILNRRAFLVTTALAPAAWPRRLHAETGTVSLAHAGSTFAHGQHLVARQKRFFDDEGLNVGSFLVPGAGAKVAQMVVAGQATFALGDSSHPLRITAKGKHALILFATDTRCSYANIVARKDLVDRGLHTVEHLADARLIGRKAVVAATAIGSGTYVYGSYVLKQVKASNGKSVNDHVEWVGGGASTTMLGGLRAGKFDAIMAAPDWRWEAETEGFGRTIYDVLDEQAWRGVFGGNIPTTVGFALKETIEKSPGIVQAYVNACYRAQQWIRKSTDDEIVELIHKPYMETSTRQDVLRSVRYYKTIFDWDFLIDEKGYANGTKVWMSLAVETPIAYTRAADMSFVRKAQAKFTS